MSSFKLAKHSSDIFQKALKDRGIDTMLEEARETNRENDAEHMKGGCKSDHQITSSQSSNKQSRNTLNTHLTASL
jgi:hypothetical protein